MPPSPRLSSRMMKTTYFTLTIRISDHTIRERTPYTAADVAVIPCSGLKHSRKA